MIGENTAATVMFNRRWQKLFEGDGRQHYPEEVWASLTEEIKEMTWNLCKEYDGSQKRRIKVLLSNFVSTELEICFGEETENFFRNEWQEEVRLFCEKYGYADA